MFISLLTSYDSSLHPSPVQSIYLPWIIYFCCKSTAYGLNTDVTIQSSLYWSTAVSILAKSPPHPPSQSKVHARMHTRISREKAILCFLNHNFPNKILSSVWWADELRSLRILIISTGTTYRPAKTDLWRNAINFPFNLKCLRDTRSYTADKSQQILYTSQSTHVTLSVPSSDKTSRTKHAELDRLRDKTQKESEKSHILLVLRLSAPTLMSHSISITSCLHTRLFILLLHMYTSIPPHS